MLRPRVWRQRSLHKGRFRHRSARHLGRSRFAAATAFASASSAQRNDTSVIQSELCGVIFGEFGALLFDIPLDMVGRRLRSMTYPKLSCQC